MTRFDWDRVQREERVRRQGSEPARDGSFNEPLAHQGLSVLESLVQKYLRAGLRGQDLVVAVANSTDFSINTVAQWIQRNHPELKRKPREVLRRERHKRK